MKKHFILFSTFAALLLSATLLTACGENVQELADNGNNVETVTETTVGENCTLFSTGDDGTRTSLGTDRKFYWSEGDQIYVNIGGTNYKKTTSSTLSSDRRTADFVLKGVSLTAPKCSVVYIGNGMASTQETVTVDELKVKIEAKQTQTAWGDSAHIGRSGDCGVAEATRDKTTGKYSLNLKHKASYLVIQPYRPTGNANPDWKLMKIEIIANGTTLAGTYDFGMGELVGTGSSNTIEFNCGTDGFDLNHTAASAAKSCFAVIQPGSHELTIRYTVKVTKKPDVLYFDNNGIDEDGIFTVDKPIAARQYAANVVTIIKHKLENNNNLYYQWGAADTYLNTWQTYGAYSMTTVAADLTDPFWSQIPNANELAWYVVKGDSHWDDQTVWSPNGGLHEYTGGIWLLKRQYIAGFNAARDPNGRNMVTDPTNHYKDNVQGKPANTTNYFFLPMLGQYFTGKLREVREAGSNGKGFYWSRSPYVSFGGASWASNLFFISSSVQLTLEGRHAGCVAVPGWFK